MLCLALSRRSRNSSLVLVRLQATEDLYAALDERRQLLLCLSDGGISSSSLLWPGQPPSQSQLALAAAAADRQVRRLLYVVENALAVLFVEFLRCLPQPQEGALPAAAHQEHSLSVFVDIPAASAQQAENRKQLGNDRDLDQLRRLLQPVLEHLLALGDEEIEQDGASVQDCVQMSRRLKEFVVLL